MHKIRTWLKDCRKALAHPAHKAERPTHVLYFLLVGYYSGGPYGAVAYVCAAITLFAWSDTDVPPHA